MGRKKLKLVTPVDVNTEKKNYQRRLPCLIKKCKEISEKTCTKVLLIVTDEVWSKPAVFCSDYLDCFFASYERAQETIIEYECDFKSDFEMAFSQHEKKKSEHPFFPYSFHKSFVPMSRRVTKGVFYRRDNVYPDNQGEIEDGMRLDAADVYVPERMAEEGMFKPERMFQSMHDVQLKDEESERNIQEHKFEIFKDILF